jgi:hypothetical protein
MVLFPQKTVTKLSKIWGWDPGLEKTYSGSLIRNTARRNEYVDQISLDIEIS